MVFMDFEGIQAINNGIYAELSLIQFYSVQKVRVKDFFMAKYQFCLRA